ncbi:MAG TPA: DUF3619 family protein [Aquabacterium sp.]|nr:DUF3619 family protein [Aquabacterium sp.]
MRNTVTPTASRARQQEALEARVALRLAGALSESAQQLPHDISERLRVARDRAVGRAAAVRRASGPVVLAQGGRSAVLGWTPPVWLRLASLMPLAVLLAGLVLIQQYHDHEQIVVAAEIDAALLTDELPPTAYGDPGFAEYLRSDPTP